MINSFPTSPISKITKRDANFTFIGLLLYSTLLRCSSTCANSQDEIPMNKDPSPHDSPSYEC